MPQQSLYEWEVFHLSCMNYKHKPNNTKTTWICPHCTTANHYNTKAKIKVTYGNSVSIPNNGNLNDRQFKLILSPTGLFNDDIILDVHLNLKKNDPTMQGLHNPILGPVH